jgi:hypothetical protein
VFNSGVLTGTVTSAAGGGIEGVSVRITDGVKAGTTVGTDSGGRFTISGLPQMGATVEVTHPAFVGQSKGFTVSPTSPNATANFNLLPAQKWTKSGVGNTVFDMPTYFTRARIKGDYTGSGSNFIMYIGGDLEVNEILGTRWPSTHYEGVHLIRGGVVEIKSSAGVSWSITEER